MTWLRGAACSLRQRFTDRARRLQRLPPLDDETLTQGTRAHADEDGTFTEEGARFVAAVENGPLSATQFHPEKSGDAGAQLLENWINTL